MWHFPFFASHTENLCGVADLIGRTRERKKAMKQTKKSYDKMTLEELNAEHIRLIDLVDSAETDRQAENRLKKLEEFEKCYKQILAKESY